jgi:hypothetical protein
MEGRSLIVDADPADWSLAGIRGEALSLDDIFISCVGIASTRI